MVITNPQAIGGPIVSATGTLTSGGQIETTATGGGTSSAQADISALQTMISQVGRLGIGWNFDSATTAGAADESFRFNNVDPASATFLYFHQNSLSGRFDEFLEQFAAGGFIYLQDNTNTGNNYLFTTTALATDEGTYYSFAVANEQSTGTFTGAAGDRFNVEFLPLSTGGGGGTPLPNRFLNEISEQDVASYVRKIDTEAEVRFWLRTELVQQATISDPGIGLRIDESNGDLGQDGDTFEQAANVNNAYIYVTLDNTFANGTDLNTVVCLIRENVGESDERIKDAVNFGTGFLEDTGLTISGRTVYRSNTGFDGNGSFINYHNTDTIELFFLDTEREFTVTEANAPNVDLTRTVNDLQENQLAQDVQAKLNQDIDLEFDDRFKLNQFVETSTESTAAVLTGSEAMYYREGSFKAQVSDWFSTTINTGLPPNLGSANYTLLVAVPQGTTVTSFSGSESGTATATEVNRDVVIEGAADRAYDLYTVVLPPTASSTNVFVPFGTRTTISEIDPTSLIKFGLDNLQTDLEARINNRPDDTILSPGLLDLNSHISVEGIMGMNWTASTNPPADIRGATYTRTFAALWDENRRSFTQNYFDDLADPTITVPSQQNIHFFADANDANNRFPGKQSWVDSTIRIQGAPLTNTFTKVWGFSARIPETFTGNVVLFQAGPASQQRVLRATEVDGRVVIQARQGNLDGALDPQSVFKNLNVINTDTNLGHMSGNAANTLRFVLTANDPVQSYLVQVRRFVNGSLTSGESFTQNITDRDTDVAATVSNLFSGELAVTHSYDANFDNNGEPTDVIQITTNNVGNASISYVVDIRYTVTEQVQTSSTSAFQTIDTFDVGTELDFVFVLERQNALNESANSPLQLKIVLNGVQENTFALNLGANAFDFSDVTFGDTRDCLISNIQIYDFSAPAAFDFPSHNLLSEFYQRRNEWFGLFRAPGFTSRNYTIDGGAILTDEDGTQFDVIERFKAIPTTADSDLAEVFQAPNTGAGLSAQEQLPASYTNFDFVHIVTYVSGTPNTFQNDFIPVALLQSTDLTATDDVGGGVPINWTVGTRTIDTADAAATLFRISMVRVQPLST